jgi:hypothetical protein
MHGWQDAPRRRSRVRGQEAMRTEEPGTTVQAGRRHVSQGELDCADLAGARARDALPDVTAAGVGFHRRSYYTAGFSLGGATPACAPPPPPPPGDADLLPTCQGPPRSRIYLVPFSLRPSESS